MASEEENTATSWGLLTRNNFGDRVAALLDVDSPHALHDHYQQAASSDNEESAEVVDNLTSIRIKHLQAMMHYSIALNSTEDVTGWRPFYDWMIVIVREGGFEAEAVGMEHVVWGNDTQRSAFARKPYLRDAVVTFIRDQTAEEAKEFLGWFRAVVEGAKCTEEMNVNADAIDNAFAEGTEV